MLRYPHKFLAALVLFFLASSLCIAQPATPLTSVAQVNALTNAEAALALPVRLEATVTFAEPQDGTLFVANDHRGVYVNFSQDIGLQQKAFYNLGNTQFQMAKKATELDGLISGLEIAEKTYDHAVSLNTNDLEAVDNLKLTKNMVESLKAFREMLLRAKNEADLDIRQADFHQALEIMAPLQSKLQHTVAEKQFKDFTKRLKDVDDIATPHSQ